MVDETALTIVSPLDLIEAADNQAIITRLENADAAAVASWCYEFPQDGQKVVGLSIDGVKEAAREMAVRGETIDEMWARIDHDASNEYEACFMAKAVRYAVSPDGSKRVEMDSAIRGTRVEKFYKTDGQFDLKKPNRYWYQQGLAKAARNATEALLPEGIKSWMIDRAKGAGRVSNPGQQARQAASTRTGTTKKADNGNIRNDTLGLMKRVREETSDYDAIMQELGEKYPSSMGRGGSLSIGTDEEIHAINNRLREALGEAVGV